MHDTGSAKDKLMTCDPSIPEKINEEKAKIEALRRKNAAEAEALQLKKDKEAREFAAEFAKRAKIFALNKAGDAQRMSFFGRPSQQSRLMKRTFHLSRLQWEEQASAWRHLAGDLPLYAAN